LGEESVNTGDVTINGIHINNAGYSGLLEQICGSISNGPQLAIAYANANSINLSFKYPELVKSLNSFDVIHPDGIGIRIAASILKSPLTLAGRFTGSDFYPLLAEEAIKNNFSLYFFGHDDITLGKISETYPNLKIAGTHEGYKFNDTEVIASIDKNPADILIIGLGSPKQETWVSLYRHKLNCKVIICVGEGIKVFAGCKKRGPRFLRSIGLEWLWRFLGNPVKYFGRYVIGNPLFLYRIISIKMRKLAR